MTCNGSSRDERTDATGAHAANPEVFEMTQAAALLELLADRLEERLAERLRHDAAEDDLRDVEHRRDRRTRPGDHDAGAFDDRRRCAPELPARARRDPARAGVHRQAPERSAGAGSSLRLDDDVAELAEVAGQSLDDHAARDERAVDLVSEHDRGEMLLSRIGIGQLPAPQL